MIIPVARALMGGAILARPHTWVSVEQRPQERGPSFGERLAPASGRNRAGAVYCQAAGGSTRGQGRAGEHCWEWELLCRGRGHIASPCLSLCVFLDHTAV
jgi:hypothetical protein